jgi:hypothetical protein
VLLAVLKEIHGGDAKVGIITLASSNAKSGFIESGDIFSSTICFRVAVGTAYYTVCFCKVY